MIFLFQRFILANKFMDFRVKIAKIWTFQFQSTPLMPTYRTIVHVTIRPKSLFAYSSIYP
jgi:hypothetical protein